MRDTAAWPLGVAAKCFQISGRCDLDAEDMVPERAV